MTYEETKNILKNITGKKEIIFFNKCREAVELIMVLAKKNNFEEVILQDEGGWHTYEKSAKKLDLNVLKAKTINGKLIKEEFPFKENSLIIINTHPGYSYKEDLNFYEEIKKQRTIIVNDITGSIGELVSKKGDYIVGSFGPDKPVSISTKGGFVACDDSSELLKIKNESQKDSGQNLDFEELLFELKNFKTKKIEWIKLSNKIKKELKNKGFKILNDDESINILVKKDNITENLIKYCEEHNLEYKVCPMYIRTNKEAISIELKKINKKN